MKKKKNGVKVHLEMSLPQKKQTEGTLRARLMSFLVHIGADSDGKSI